MEELSIKLYEKMTDNMNWVLRPYLLNGIYRPTKGITICRDFYLIDADISKETKNRGFIARLRKDSNKVNVCLGLPHEKLSIPEGFPIHKRNKDSYNKNQWEFDVHLENPYDWPLSLFLAVQVAEYKLKELSLNPKYEGIIHFVRYFTSSYHNNG